MKTFRYKVTFCEEERILSVGINVEKRYFYVEYSFAHVILAPQDAFNIKIEQGKLAKRLSDYSQDEYNFDLPLEFQSYGALRSFAFSYSVRVMNDWCDLRGIQCDIKITDYKLPEVTEDDILSF